MWGLHGQQTAIKKIKCRDPLWFTDAAEDVDHFHKLLHARLDKTLKLVDPRKSVVFALDGPAPLAKLLTQRYGL